MSHKASLACAGAFAAAATFAGIGPALSHTIVGNRVFPATLAIDDPGVNDEWLSPCSPTRQIRTARTSSTSISPMQKTITCRFGFSIARHVHPSHQYGETGWDHRHAERMARHRTQLKYVLYQNAEHEFIVSVAGQRRHGATPATSASARRSVLGRSQQKALSARALAMWRTSG